MRRPPFRLISILLTSLLVFSSSASIAQQAIDDTGLNAARERAKSAVQIAFQQQKRVKVVLTGDRKLEGSVRNVTDSGFEINDRKSGPQQIAFSDLQQVRRAGMSTGKKWAIAGGIAGGILIPWLAWAARAD